MNLSRKRRFGGEGEIPGRGRGEKRLGIRGSPLYIVVIRWPPVFETVVLVISRNGTA